MKTCMYLRKSRADRDNPNVSDQEVLKRHRETLLAYAKENDLDVIDIKEEVVSGESLSRRPEMLKLLEEIEDNKFSAVLVMDFDRLGRGSMMEQGIIINAFKQSNTKIITPNKVYDLDDDFDEEYLDISAFFARKELKMITKRLHRGRMKSLEEGNYISPHAPFGYDKKDKTLVINEKEADIIKLIFDLYINNGMGDTKIANYLKENKVYNKNNNVNWDRTTIRKIIQNPVYIGKVSWGKREYKYKEDGKRTSKFLNKSEWKVYDGKHEAIIDEETFKKAQLLSKERYQPHIHNSKCLRNPLAYTVKCKNCGATMTLRTYKNKPDSLRCYKNCGNKSSYVYLVEEKVIRSLRLALTNLQHKLKYKKENVPTTEINIILTGIKETEAELTKVYNQKEKLYTLLEQGIYDNSTFLERMNKVTNLITDLENKLSQYYKNKELYYQTKEEIEETIPRINTFKEFIDNIYWESNVEDRNAFLRSVIDHVAYQKEPTAMMDNFEISITLKIG